MRRIAVTCAALTALCGGAAVVRAADTPLVGTPVARLVDCNLGGPDRSAVFYGRMDAIPGAGRMAIRFVLLERLGRDSDWSRVDVPSLHLWHRSAPGVKTFGYKQTVDNLRAGAAYKARLTFRWSTPAGALLDTEARETPVCRGPLPNLTVGGVEVHPGPTDNTRTYRVTIDNDGHADADNVDVVLNVDRAVLDTVTIDQLDAGDAHTVTFTGPPCTRAMRVRVDPDNTIGELDEDDNAQLIACP